MDGEPSEKDSVALVSDWVMAPPSIQKKQNSQYVVGFV
jgi:hypothetical protein